MNTDVVDVSDWPVVSDEYLGGKPKRWLEGEGGTWLCKWPEPNNDARHGTYLRGDDWAELLAAGVAELLGVPSAEVRLAVHRGAPCVISKSFLAEGELLQHGNELLSGINREYDGAARRPVGYTVQAAVAALRAVDGLTAPDGTADAIGTFAGYLLLDAVINNLDRHHENWAVASSVAGIRLAVSYDHGSAFASSEPDARRERLLGDPAALRAFDERATTWWHPKLHPVEAARQALILASASGPRWLTQLTDAADQILMLPRKIPEDRCSAVAAALCAALLAQRVGTLTHLLGSLEP